MTMEDVNKTVTTTMGATPAHATLDMLAVASVDVWVSMLVTVVNLKDVFVLTVPAISY